MQDRVMRAGTGEYSIWDSFPVLSQQILWRFYRGTFWYTLVPSERISFSPLATPGPWQTPGIHYPTLYLQSPPILRLSSCLFLLPPSPTLYPLHPHRGLIQSLPHLLQSHLQNSTYRYYTATTPLLGSIIPNIDHRSFPASRLLAQ